MQTLPAEIEILSDSDNSQLDPEDQPNSNLSPIRDTEPHLLTEAINKLNTGTRIGPKLPHNTNSLRTNLKDSPIYSVHDSGAQKTKTGQSDDIRPMSNPSISDWNTESISTAKQLQSSNTKSQNNKSPNSAKAELLGTPDSK